MKVEATAGDVLGGSRSVAILAWPEGVDLPEAVAASIEAGDFTGKANQTVVAYLRADGLPARLVLVGLGATDEVDAERIRQAAASGVKVARSFSADQVAIGLAGGLPVVGADLGEALAVGLLLGNYRFLRYRTNLSDAEAFEIDSVQVVVPEAEVAGVADGITTGSIVAGGVLLARDLVNTPGVDKTPPQLAERAVELGERNPAVTVTIFDETELEAQGFGGVLAVGKGSDSPPRFIIMEYGADLVDVPTVCLVGKGLTFDSGGLNIKVGDFMTNMKNDMGGSAAVFGALQAAAGLELPIHLVGLVPSAENMPSGRSYRPGDIVTTLSGSTIEILNTDAEGRVILSDGLHYAQRYEPDAIVELSTLTGAVIVALAHHATGLMATDQDLADALLAAGQTAGDRAWQLPLWDDYREMVKSEVADVKNLAGPPGGSITAGAFLAHFAGEVPFAHLDIAGTAWLDKPTKPHQVAGGTGAGVRLVVEYLRTLSGARGGN